MKTFEEQLKDICDDGYKKSEFWRMLAKTRKFVGLDDRWLGAKMQLVGRAVGAPLEDGLCRFDENGHPSDVVVFSNIDRFYTFVADHVQMNYDNEFWKDGSVDLEFNGSEYDLKRLVKVLKAILDFDDVINAAVASYSAEGGEVRGVQNREYIEFADKFIFFHYSQAAFPYSRHLWHTAKRILSEGDVYLGETLIPCEIKNEIRDEYTRFYDSIISRVQLVDVPQYRERFKVCDFYARAYALACYIKRNGYSDFLGPYSTAVVCDVFESLSWAPEELPDYSKKRRTDKKSIPQDKVYDTGDIEIVSAALGAAGVGGRTCYDCDVVIGGDRYSAKWYPRDKKYQTAGTHAGGVQNLLAVLVDGHKNTIAISDGVIKAIDDKIYAASVKADIKSILDDYEKHVSEQTIEKTLAHISPNDIYHSLNRQAAERVSVEHGRGFCVAFFYIIKAFMYGYYSTHAESIIERIGAELDAVYKTIADLSVQEAIDGGYYDKK